MSVVQPGRTSRLGCSILIVLLLPMLARRNARDGRPAKAREQGRARAHACGVGAGLGSGMGMSGPCRAGPTGPTRRARRHRGLGVNQR